MRPTIRPREIIITNIATRIGDVKYTPQENILMICNCKVHGSAYEWIMYNAFSNVGFVAAKQRKSRPAPKGRIA
jgi:hypothetical protein